MRGIMKNGAELSRIDGRHYINGCIIDIYDIGNSQIEYYDYYGYGGKHTATLRPAEWTKHLHGNPPAGTYYGSFRLQLPNGQRVTLPVYI